MEPFDQGSMASDLAAMQDDLDAMQDDLDAGRCDWACPDCGRRYHGDVCPGCGFGEAELAARERLEVDW